MKQSVREFPLSSLKYCWILEVGREVDISHIFGVQHLFFLLEERKSHFAKYKHI